MPGAEVLSENSHMGSRPGSMLMHSQVPDHKQGQSANRLPLISWKHWRGGVDGLRSPSRSEGAEHENPHNTQIRRNTAGPFENSLHMTVKASLSDQDSEKRACIYRAAIAVEKMAPAQQKHKAFLELLDPG